MTRRPRTRRGDPLQLHMPLSFPRVLQCVAADPKNSLHHLDFHRDSWRLRVLIWEGRKTCGRRIAVKLKTTDPEVAKQKRDRIMTALARNGLLTARVLLKSGLSIAEFPCAENAGPKHIILTPTNPAQNSNNEPELELNYETDR